MSEPIMQKLDEMQARTDLPKALAALRAALEDADTIVKEFEHPAYRGNGYAEGLAASARQLRSTITDALGVES